MSLTASPPFTAPRSATIVRSTSETDIRLALDLDGTGRSDIATGIGFLDHMLTALARHGLLDLDIQAKGDLHIDFHHTTEDVGIVLGRAVAQALGDKRGIRRFGQALVPMDEALAEAAIDISGRPFLAWSVDFRQPKVGETSTPSCSRSSSAPSPPTRCSPCTSRSRPAATPIMSPRPASKPPRAPCGWRSSWIRADRRPGPLDQGVAVIVWTVHMRHATPPVLVREGFSLGWAGVRPALAARPSRLDRRRAVRCWHRPRRSRCCRSAPPGPVLAVGIAWAIGLFGRDLLRWSLENRGFTLVHVVAERDRDSALARLLERRPDLIGDALINEAVR